MCIARDILKILLIGENDMGVMKLHYFPSFDWPYVISDGWTKGLSRVERSVASLFQYWKPSLVSCTSDTSGSCLMQDDHSQGNVSVASLFQYWKPSLVFQTRREVARCRTLTFREMYLLLHYSSIESHLLYYRHVGKSRDAGRPQPAGWDGAASEERLRQGHLPRLREPDETRHRQAGGPPGTQDEVGGGRGGGCYHTLLNIYMC